MRIIAGQFKGRQLLTPAGKGTRPTSDQVREAIFNLVQARLSLEGADVLDLFCGTAALGLEALSRGAASATLVDSSRPSLRIAVRNVALLGVERRCTLLQRDVTRYLKRNPERRFDLILADPPYEMKGIADFPELAIRHLTDRGLLVLEHDRQVRFEETPFQTESRSYGRTIVTIFRRSSDDSSKQMQSA